MGWRRVESLQRGGLLEDALATRAAIRVSPAPNRRGDVPRDGTWQLLFATDRRFFEDVEPGFRLGATRGDMLFGAARLTPAGGRVGLANLSVSRSAAGFERSIAQQLADAPTKELLLYIHGYNNTFVDAVTTAKGIIDVIGFTGVPVLFSWPSDGKALNYSADEEEVRTSRNGHRRASASSTRA